MVGPSYNQNMLLAASHFWEDSTNTLQLRCGMITPTFLDVTAITGLWTTDKVFNPSIQNEDNIGFNSKRVSFTNFIIDHFDEMTNEVYDEEHISFLSLWLLHFVFLLNFFVSRKSICYYSQPTTLWKKNLFKPINFGIIPSKNLVLLTIPRVYSVVWSLMASSTLA